jgi:hypothetical protein
MRTETKVTKFTLTSEKNGSGTENNILRKNGNICSCPFRNPVILPHPSIQGQMVIQNPVCSDQCHFFDIDENENLVFLSCTNTPFQVLIEKEKKSDYSHPQDTKLFTL